MIDLEAELLQIRERNARVEADKAWETSLFRKLLIAIITYAVAALALLVTGAPNYLLGAFVPVLGFLLSTLTLSAVKRWWLRRRSSGK